jgi:hypothetical protein
VTDVVEKVCPREGLNFFKDLGAHAYEIREEPPRFLTFQRAALATALR